MLSCILENFSKDNISYMEPSYPDILIVRFSNSLLICSYPNLGNILEFICYVKIFNQYLFSFFLLAESCSSHKDHDVLGNHKPNPNTKEYGVCSVEFLAVVPSSLRTTSNSSTHLPLLTVRLFFRSFIMILLYDTS